MSDTQIINRLGAPRRAVAETRRVGNDIRRLVVLQTLSCGHTMRFTGERAFDAKYAKHRFCKACRDAEKTS